MEIYVRHNQWLIGINLSAYAPVHRKKASIGTAALSVYRYLNQAKTEKLRYLSAKDNKVVGIETVDDGTGIDGRPFPGDRHIVGDDSAIRVEGGVIRIAYQDASAQTLRLATGTVDGAKHKWSLKEVAQPGRSAGFFPQFVPGDSRIANFWQAVDKSTNTPQGGVSIVQP